MLFNSIEFLLFFLPITFFIYFFLNKRKFYNFALLFLLLASLFFYGTYKIDYVYIIICSILFNYLISLSFKVEQLQNFKKLFLTIGILGNVLILFGFKYFNYLFETLKNVFHFPINTIEIMVPLGISFFTIQQISFIVDCYKKEVVKYNFINYALFICYFPQFLAGPIVRHQEVIPQFQNLKNRIMNQENIFRGLFLITIGLLKKVLIADNFVDFIDCVIDYSLYNDCMLSWFFAFAKVAQGYFDFSGYCDIAYGSAFLFNIKFPVNFNSPFKATSIIDYWSRWHMTLIRFLKDYILIPLGGTTSGSFKAIRNVMITSFAYGCWKAISPVNIVYGLMNGVLICINLFWAKLNIKLNKHFSNLITFITILFTTPFITQTNINDSISLFKSMALLEFYTQSFKFSKYCIDFGDYYSVAELKLPILLLIFCVYSMFISKNSIELADDYVEANNTFYTVILAIVLTICTLSITKYREFVYFNFN